MSTRTLFATLVLLSAACELPSKNLGEPIDGTEGSGGTSGPETSGQTSDPVDSTGEGSTTTPQTSGGSTGQTSDTSGGDVMCGGDPQAFPEFSKQCATVDDCALVIHQTDCCGNMAALGLDKAEVPAFDAAEAICASQYPGCGCPSMGIVAEDGVLVSDAAAIHLACVDNQCQTYIGEDCAFLVGRTFLSDEQLECGLGPNGVELCNWTVSFTATMFNYQHSDLGESSDYTCEAGVITAGSYTGTVDAETGKLVWDGVAFTVAP